MNAWFYLISFYMINWLSIILSWWLVTTLKMSLWFKRIRLVSIYYNYHPSCRSNYPNCAHGELFSGLATGFLTWFWSVWHSFLVLRYDKMFQAHLVGFPFKSTISSRKLWFIHWEIVFHEHNLDSSDTTATELVTVLSWVYSVFFHLNSGRRAFT